MLKIIKNVFKVILGLFVLGILYAINPILGGVVAMVTTIYISYKLLIVNGKFSTKKRRTKIIYVISLSLALYFLGILPITSNSQASKDKQIAKVKYEENLKIEQEKAEVEALRLKKEEEEETIKNNQIAEEKRIQEEKDKIAKDIQDKLDKEESDRKSAELEKVKYDTGLTYEDLARNPKNHIGDYVKFNGKVIQVMNGKGFTQYRLALNDNYDKIIIIEVDNKLLKNGNILENDKIFIKGMSLGSMSYKTVLGAENTIPAVNVESFEMK